MADSRTRPPAGSNPPGHTRDRAVVRRPYPLVSILYTHLPSWVTVIKYVGCADSGLDPEQWFPVSQETGEAQQEAAAAISVCGACPARARCLELPLRHWDIGQHGVWGGLVAADRAHLRRKRHPSIAGEAARAFSPQIQTQQRGGPPAEYLRAGLIPVPRRGRQGERRAARSARQLQPITGLVAFYNEKTDIDVDGVRLPRARTHFFR